MHRRSSPIGEVADERASEPRTAARTSLPRPTDYEDAVSFLRTAIIVNHTSSQL